MTETEKKIEALLFESPWRSAIAHVATWHDEEMSKLKQRLIGVVKRSENRLMTVTYYDGGDIVTAPSKVVADVVKEMEAVDSPKPIKPPQEHETDVVWDTKKACMRAVMGEAAKLQLTARQSQSLTDSILALDKPAEPLSPFGCKCWVLDNHLMWIPEPTKAMIANIDKRDNNCRFCGKARVEK